MAKSLAEKMEEQIAYEQDGYFVWNDPSKSYFEVFAPDVTCSYRIASIGKKYGLERAIAEIDKRRKG